MVKNRFPFVSAILSLLAERKDASHMLLSLPSKHSEYLTEESSSNGKWVTQIQPMFRFHLIVSKIMQKFQKKVNARITA